MMTDTECELENLKIEMELLKKKYLEEQRRRRFAETEVINVKNKMIAGHIMSEKQLNEFIERDCKLLTSQGLAKVLNVSEGALRKQRSLNRSMFPFARIGRRIFYPADLIVQTVHKHVKESPTLKRK
jgi:hypothetical protein